MINYYLLFKAEVPNPPSVVAILALLGTGARKEQVSTRSSIYACEIPLPPAAAALWTRQYWGSLQL